MPAFTATWTASGQVPTAPVLLVDFLRLPRLYPTHYNSEQLDLASSLSFKRRWTPIGNIWSIEQKKTLQEIAMFTAALSVLTSLVTAYWFFRMRKKFRHKIVMSLILGDLIRTISMLVMSAISLATGQMVSHSATCQAGGFFFQFGTIMNDWSALMLAVHGTIQIFRPSVSTANNGDIMFRYRHFVYAALIVIPALCSSLNFVMETGHYTASGAFCQLPIRPLWYRLSLAWIPRYIIGLTILGMALAVYIHVRNVYKGTTESKWWALSSIAIPKNRVEAHMPDDSFAIQSLDSEAGRPAQFSRDIFDIGLTDMPQGRRVSTISTVMSSNPSRKTWPSDTPTASITPQLVGGRHASVMSMFTSASSTVPHTTLNQYMETPAEESTDLRTPPLTARQAPMRPTRPQRISSTISDISGRTGSLKGMNTIAQRVPLPAVLRRRARSAPSHLHVQRAIIRRQLRLTFIYPMVYLLMWLAPFTLHCMQYNTYYAEQPPFPLGIVANICYTMMAAVDCAIFCYRERPWRHIPANKSRGFWSSFCCCGGVDEVGCDVIGSNDDQSGRWGSFHEKHNPQQDRKRHSRVGSIDSDVEVAPGAMKEENRRDIADSRPRPASRARLSTIPSAAAHTGVSPDGKNSEPTRQKIPYLGQSAALILSAVTQLSSRFFRHFFRRSQRSDAQHVADEYARARLAVEIRDREEQRLEDVVEQRAEKHWWDRARKDSDQTDCAATSGRKNSFWAVLTRGEGSWDGSQAASPGQNLEERVRPPDFPQITTISLHHGGVEAFHPGSEPPKADVDKHGGASGS